MLNVIRKWLYCSDGAFQFLQFWTSIKINSWALSALTKVKKATFNFLIWHLTLSLYHLYEVVSARNSRETLTAHFLIFLMIVANTNNILRTRLRKSNKKKVRGPRACSRHHYLSASPVTRAILQFTKMCRQNMTVIRKILIIDFIIFI